MDVITPLFTIRGKTFLFPLLISIINHGPFPLQRILLLHSLPQRTPINAAQRLFLVDAFRDLTVEQQFHLIWMVMSIEQTAEGEFQTSGFNCYLKANLAMMRRSKYKNGLGYWLWRLEVFCTKTQEEGCKWVMVKLLMKVCCWYKWDAVLQHNKTGWIRSDISNIYDTFSRENVTDTTTNNWLMYASSFWSATTGVCINVFSTPLDHQLTSNHHAAPVFITIALFIFYKFCSLCKTSTLIKSRFQGSISIDQLIKV